MSEAAAIELLTRAVQLDVEQRYSDAFHCYSEGIRLLILAAKEIPTSEERKRSAYRQKLTECMDRAEQLKELMRQEQKAKNLHEQIQIKDNSIGNSYEKLFSRFFDGKVTELIVQDPYIRAHHQICNFLRFCECLIKYSSTVKRIHLITSTETNEQSKQIQINQLNDFKDHLNKKHAIELFIEYRTGLHDREIKLNSGWIIKIGRGLDFYKPPESKFSIGYYDLDLRPCHQTTIDIFHAETMNSSSS